MLKIPTLKNRKTVFLAVGNIMRADDAFGPLVYEELSARKSPDFLPLNGAEMPENFTAKIKAFAPDYLIVADALLLSATDAELGEQAGTILGAADYDASNPQAGELGPTAGELQIINEAEMTDSSLSTHSLPLSVMFKFLKQDLPLLQIIFIAACAAYTGFDKKPSQKITAAAKEAAAAIIRKL